MRYTISKFKEIDINDYLDIINNPNLDKIDKLLFLYFKKMRNQLPLSTKKTIEDTLKKIYSGYYSC